MEKKYRIADVADILGVTPKTVYRMVSRNELRTVNEKVNNRTITLLTATEAEIETLKANYGKLPVNDGNCKDILTDIDASLTANNQTQTNNNDFSASEMLDKIIEINKEYNNQLMKVNEELVNAKAQMLFLEDKASREGMYLNEINGLRTENNQLKKTKEKLSYMLIAVIVILLLVIVGYFTYNIATSEKKEHTQEEIVNPQ